MQRSTALIRGVVLKGKSLCQKLHTWADLLGCRDEFLERVKIKIKKLEIIPACLVATCWREELTSRSKNQTTKKNKTKKLKENSQKMFHALMSLGRRKQSCNPILIVVDLLNRSSRFKSQQITQKAQGDVQGGWRVRVVVGDVCGGWLHNQVHLRWYGSSLTRQDRLRGRGDGHLKNVKSFQMI